MKKRPSKVSKKTQKPTKKKLKGFDVEFSLKVPGAVANEFQQASEKILKRYDRILSPELLMVWVLTGISEKHLLNEFEEALDMQTVTGSNRTNR